MSSIKVGDVVFHKASGEPGYVIALTTEAPEGTSVTNLVDMTKFSGTFVVVRSPKGSEHLATSYVNQVFLVEEVETREGQLEREQDLMSQIFQRGNTKGTNGGDLLGALAGGNVQN